MTWLRVQRRNTLWVTSKAAYEGRATEHCGLPHPRPARLFLWSRHPLGNLSNPCQQAGNQSVKAHPPKPDLRVHSQLSVVTVQMPDLHCMQICTAGRRQAWSMAACRRFGQIVRLLVITQL